MGKAKYFVYAKFVYGGQIIQLDATISIRNKDVGLYNFKKVLIEYLAEAGYNNISTNEITIESMAKL